MFDQENHAGIDKLRKQVSWRRLPRGSIDTAWRFPLKGACFKNSYACVNMFGHDMICWECPRAHHRYMSLLPLKVQGKFMFDLCGKGGAEHLLLDKTLCPGKAVAALYRDLKQVCMYVSTMEHLGSLVVALNIAASPSALAGAALRFRAPITAEHVLLLLLVVLLLLMLMLMLTRTPLVMLLLSSSLLLLRFRSLVSSRTPYPGDSLAILLPPLTWNAFIPRFRAPHRFLGVRL